MPFTVSPSSYKGGDYLFQGISNAANSITGAINQYAQISDQATQSDALMKYLSQQNDPVSGKPIIDQKALEAYQNHNMRQRAFVAGGIHAGMTLADSLQKLGYANRETLARTNELTAHAHYLNQQADQPGGPGGGTDKIWCDVLNGYATPTQCNNARLKTTAGQLQQNYGLKADDIFNSNIHEGGTVTVDPTTNAKKFTNEANGDQIRIGGPQGVVMPRAEFEIYKRQLNMGGFTPGGQAGGAAAGGAPAAAPGATRAAPQVGERRIIQGQQAVWDGTGWKAAGA